MSRDRECLALSAGCETTEFYMRAALGVKGETEGGEMMSLPESLFGLDIGRFEFHCYQQRRIRGETKLAKVLSL